MRRRMKMLPGSERRQELRDAIQELFQHVPQTERASKDEADLLAILDAEPDAESSGESGQKDDILSEERIAVEEFSDWLREKGIEVED
jgi:hypothetical protein